MWNEINAIMELSFVFIGVFLVEKYVFLEPGLKDKKLRLYYMSSILFVLITYLLWGKDAATYVILFAGGLNISLGRKTNRFWSFFLIIPICGIVDGLFVPVIVMPTSLTDFSQKEDLMYSFAVYALIAILLLLFYRKGKEWRRQFQEEMEYRHLQKWECFLLCGVGLLQLFFSHILNKPADYMLNSELAAMENIRIDRITIGIIVLGITAFILTIIIIVLIMQGNKRSYYHEQVADMQFGIITIMADIVESRDENTGGHIKRTAKYVEIIARTLKKQGVFPDTLTDAYLSDMVVAAPLHDIGKVQVSDAILNKPGKLTEEEFEIMKSHAPAGRDLLQEAKKQLGESGYLNIAIDMAAYHHEWWNGKGYPEGIKEQQIPLCARIMAVADVFDALISRRCYKKAMPLEKAYGILREESGTHFDPVIVEAFFAAAPEIEDVLREFNDIQ